MKTFLICAQAVALGLAGWGGRSVCAAAELDVRRDATVAVVEQVMPSVVNIATVRAYNGDSAETFVSAGSGVIIDEAGYLLTNEHVVHDAKQIGVQFNSGTNLYYLASVLASDPKRDVALLKLHAKPGEKFQAIKLAREDDLLLGETVVALGNPFGLDGTVTRGILSSKSRLVPKEGAPLEIRNLLQTDAPINEGNSGGPLINMRGELIGINSAVVSSAQSLGFAIPIRIVEEALADILPTEYVKSYWFGARVKVGSYPLVITSVQPESPAGHAGLKAGDVVLQVNGKVPKSFIEFGDLLASGGTSDISITFRRGSETTDLKVKLVPEKSVFNADMIRRRLGLSLEPLAPGGAGAFAITGVQAESPAEAAGLKERMLVASIDGQVPPDLTALAKYLFSKKSGERLVLAVPTVQRVGPFTFRGAAAFNVTLR